MPSTFPGAIDSFTDPLANSSLASPSHSTLHSDINDAVEKVEQYMGLVKVIPTAATNGTINATTGTVTIGNAVSSVSVTCFSALYDVYRIIITGGTSSVASSLRLQLSGSTGSTYQMYGYYNDFGTAALIGYSPAAATSWTDAVLGGTSRYQATIELNGPFLTVATLGHTVTHSTASAYNFHLRDTSTASSTGFTLTPNSGTITGGSIRVYGYRN